MPNDTASFIAGHDPQMSREELIEQGHERIADFDALRESLPERPHNLSSFAEDAHALAGLYHRVSPDAPEVLFFLRIMAHAIAADAARLIPGRGPVRVDIIKLGTIELPPTDETPPPLLRVGHITRAYHAAFAAGDKPALALLATAPIERIAHTPPSVEESYLMLHARGLQMLAGGDIGGNDLLISAINGCNSAAMSEGARSYARLVASPEIELALLHGMDDQQAREAGLPTFDEALRNALVWHRHYWTDFEPNPGERYQRRHPEGFIALGPLAWATMRRDASLPFGMTSDYLPRSVIESHK